MKTLHTFHVRGGRPCVDSEVVAPRLMFDVHSQTNGGAWLLEASFTNEEDAIEHMVNRVDSYARADNYRIVYNASDDTLVDTGGEMC